MAAGSPTGKKGDAICDVRLLNIDKKKSRNSRCDFFCLSAGTLFFQL